MPLEPHPVHRYHVFLASPGDDQDERHAVRKFFHDYNRTTAHLWNAEFVVIDWENYSTIGGMSLLARDRARPRVAAER